MLQDLAETLLVFPQYLTPSINENSLFILIGSGVESLQKAAFVLLKYLYQNYIPTMQFSVSDSDQILSLKQEQESTEVEEQKQIMDD